jgi:hypothetical protein
MTGSSNICLKKLFFFVAILFLSFQTFAQRPYPFLKPDTTLNKTKLGVVVGSKVAVFGSALLLLNHYWYKNYPRSRFHFFDDGKEWLQMDKTGHIYGAYFASHYAVGLYKWAGMPRRKAIWIGGTTGTVLLSSIEILDGFSKEWGFSWWDFGFNAIGSAIVIGQELAWDEQRIKIKISATPQKYPAGELRQRANQLYGNSTFELFLKDYNALTAWASLNIGSFIHRETRFPKWLNVAVGYGANGLYGGFENKWCLDENGKYENCPDALKVDRSDVQRYRQYYLSLDIDWTQIPTRRKGWKVLFTMLNLVKVPFPALEFSRVDKVKVRPF